MPEKQILYWNKDVETIPRRELESLQLERLRMTAALVYQKVPFYREALDRKGVKPESLRSLADLPRLPFTTKTTCASNIPSNS